MLKPVNKKSGDGKGSVRIKNNNRSSFGISEPSSSKASSLFGQPVSLISRSEIIILFLFYLFKLVHGYKNTFHLHFFFCFSFYLLFLPLPFLLFSSPLLYLNFHTLFIMPLFPFFPFSPIFRNM